MAFVKLLLLGMSIALFSGCIKEKKPLTYEEKYQKVRLKYSSMNEAEQLEAIERDWQYIHFMHHPSKKVQLAALEKNPEAIEDIDRPCIEAQMLAVKKLIDDHGAFSIILTKQIKRFDEPAQIAAVTKAPQLIRYIPYPSVKVQLAAIKQNPWIAKSINHLSKEAKEAAVKQNPKLRNFL